MESYWDEFNYAVAFWGFDADEDLLETAS